MTRKELYQSYVAFKSWPVDEDSSSDDTYEVELSQSGVSPPASGMFLTFVTHPPRRRTRASGYPEQPAPRLSLWTPAFAGATTERVLDSFVWLAPRGSWKSGLAQDDFSIGRVDAVIP
jgi:hypothetical protein